MFIRVSVRHARNVELFIASRTIVRLWDEDGLCVIETDDDKQYVRDDLDAETIASLIQTAAVSD